MTGTATREEMGFADKEKSRQIDISENAISARSARIEEIDGIRGWAALAVVVFHALPETFSKIHPELINPIWWFFLTENWLFVFSSFYQGMRFRRHLW